MVQLNCAHCGVPFQAKPYEVENGRCCCSRTCARFHRPRIPAEIRFWKHVNKTDSCWLWTGAKHKYGYGMFNLGPPSYKSVTSHRYAWELINGPIQNNLEVCHDCPGGDVPNCCFPSHMFLGDQKANMQDAAQKGRTVCGENHPASKLTETQVKEMRQLYSEGVPVMKLCTLFNLTHGSVGAILSGRVWKHLLLPKYEQMTML